MRLYVLRAEPKEVRRSVDARAPRADPIEARRSPPGVFSDASDVLADRRSPPGVCFPGVVVSVEGRRVVDADDARREPVAEGRRFVMGVLGGTMSRARASLWTAAAARMHRSCAISTAASASAMLFRRASARSASFARVRGVRAGPSKETVFVSASARMASRLVSASS